MEWMDDLKALMYRDDISDEAAFEINHIIYKYDEGRAKTDKEIERAGNEWRYRLQQLCDYRIIIKDYK